MLPRAVRWGAAGAGWAVAGWVAASWSAGVSSAFTVVAALTTAGMAAVGFAQALAEATADGAAWELADLGAPAWAAVHLQHLLVSQFSG